jgi:hypothetical protein
MDGDLDMAQHTIVRAVLDGGIAFPTDPAPVVGQYFYRTDEGVLYICSSAGPPAVWTAVGGGSTGSAPDDASYALVGGADVRLPDARVITQGDFTSIVDGGAGEALTFNNTAPDTSLVLASGTDAAPGTLWDKILIGPSLTRLLSNPGADETITLDTVAPPAFTLAVQGASHFPAARSTLFFGMNPKVPVATAQVNKIYIRRACTLKVAEIYCYAVTAGSNENWALAVRLNDTTDTTIATVGAMANERVFSNTGLSVALVAGDYLEINSVAPNWGTPPTGVTFGGYLYFE